MPALPEEKVTPQCIVERLIAGAIDALYQRDLEAVGAAARQHVETNYSWTRALQALMGRYQAAVAARNNVGVETALPSATLQ